MTHEFLQTSNGFDVEFLLKSEIKQLFQQEQNAELSNELLEIMTSPMERKVQALKELSKHPGSDSSLKDVLTELNVETTD